MGIKKNHFYRNFLRFYPFSGQNSGLFVDGCPAGRDQVGNLAGGVSADAVETVGRQHWMSRYGERHAGLRAVGDPMHIWKLFAQELGYPILVSRYNLADNAGWAIV